MDEKRTVLNKWAQYSLRCTIFPSVRRGQATTKRGRPRSPAAPLNFLSMCFLQRSASSQPAEATGSDAYEHQRAGGGDDCAVVDEGLTAAAAEALNMDTDSKGA